MTNHLPAEELELLIAVLPRNLQAAVRGHERHNELVEIVMDLGRSPEFRTFDSYTVFDHLEVTQSDLKHVIDRVGDFGDDNRAGIARTLHRISAIRNRKARIIGLTLRVGRAVYGTAEIVRDIIASGNSILLLGRPGVGKTTMLRETARILADDKRVVIVDTSNEIAGDGDIPHPAIGRARRMQVSTPALQHEVMIEAVENHNPQVIVIDEIGRELEAQAARTIAERGVQLIGTAHGNALDNLLMNPTLSDLIGGIESVTLSDEEARRRGTQKSVLERRAPPTFDILIEIQDWQRLAIHPDVAAAVDGLLRSRPQAAELRYVDSSGEVVSEKGPTAAAVEKKAKKAPSGRRLQNRGEPAQEPRGQGRPKLLLFPYGVSQNRLRQSAKSLSLPLVLTDDLGEADAVMTLKSYYRKRPVVINDAESKQIPIYVLRSNTYTQIENALVDMFGLSLELDEYDTAMQEGREAVQQVLNHSRPMVELSPRSASIRRQQHDMARQANLLSLSRGKEPNRRVRIYRKD